MNETSSKLAQSNESMIKIEELYLFYDALTTQIHLYISRHSGLISYIQQVKICEGFFGCFTQLCAHLQVILRVPV